MLRSFFLSSVIVLSLFGPSSTALAAELQTVTFQVDNMTCSMCPYTVKKALKKVDGIEKIEARYEGRGEGWAKVTFDPDKTTIETLIKASTEAGYPARAP